MIVETFAAGGRTPSSVTGTRLVVRDAHGNPIMVAVEHGPNEIICAHLADPDFDTLLAALGVEASVVLRRFVNEQKE